MGDTWARDFARETWSLYGVGIFIVVLRYTARIRRLGIRGLKVDDYVMANGIVWYTILCVAFNQIAGGGGSNLMTQEEIDELTPEIKEHRIAGSKWVFVSEHSMILAIWSMKVCMLVLYANLTEGLKQRKWVNWVAIYTVCSFVGSELAVFLACRPIQQYWAVPAANPQCSTYQYFEIANGCLSIPGDIAILGIGIPILAALRMPAKQKAILLIIFSMGGFIIVAAILTKVYCLVPSLISYVYMNWYFREASVAVYVTNLPAIWPLFREIFPAVQTWGTRSKVSGNTSDHTWVNSESRSRYAKEEYDMRGLKKGPRAESQERINDSDSASSLSPHTISVRREVTFTSEANPRAHEGPHPEAWNRGKEKTTTVVHAV